MISISLRAVLIVGLLSWLTFTGELPWWILAAVVFYQFTYQFNFWLPGQKKKVMAKIEQVIKQQELAYMNQLPKNVKPTDIN